MGREDGWPRAAELELGKRDQNPPGQMWDLLEQEPGRAGIPVLHPRTALTTCEGAGLGSFLKTNHLADRRFYDFRINLFGIRSEM